MLKPSRTPLLAGRYERDVSSHAPTHLDPVFPDSPIHVSLIRSKLTKRNQQLLLRPRHRQQHHRDLVHRDPLTASNGELVNVTRTPCADDARYTWAWTILTSGTGAESDAEADTSTTNTTCNIEYWFDGSGYSLYASHHVPADQIVWTNQQSPTGTVQAYAGPANFTVPVASVS
ncbi:hypothetical protein PG993_008482 [Apiospora rasikravindrae]|uniref:Uncharacterized protein n=1 Tax=Apiospora rasikravindrae TaxID=990691 RepID=A0ABR1T1Y7_9PEZI